jgi:peroxiredoxin
MRIGLLALSLLAAGCGLFRDSGTCGGLPSVPTMKEGDKAPSFTIRSMDGAGTLAVAPGKVTLVDFWATWCGPCRHTFPRYQQLYARYKASGLEIVAVSVDEDRGGIESFAKDKGAEFPIGWDEGGETAKKWKVVTVPSLYLIDKEGVVKHIHTGYHDDHVMEIEKEIKALL